MEPADLINANHRRLLSNACPDASQVILLFFVEFLSAFWDYLWHFVLQECDNTPFLKTI